jgi:DNA-binding CsgD family transcriptional regulator
MNKSQRLGVRDLRSLYLLLGECCEMGRRPLEWQSHLLAGLGRILGVRVGTCGSLTFVNGEYRPGHIHILVGADLDQTARYLQHYHQQRIIERDPYPQFFLHQPGDVVTCTWDQAMTPEQWRSSEAFNECYRPAGLDHLMVSRCSAGPNAMHTIYLHRELGGSPYQLRHRRLLYLFHVELHRVLGTRLAINSEYKGAADLPPRLRQVLAMLMEGHSEKQVADSLDLSAQTIHNYTKSLHQSFAATCRGELLARAWRRYGDPALWDDLPGGPGILVCHVDNPSRYRPS